MLYNIILIQYISTTLANYGLSSSFSKSIDIFEGYQTPHERYPRLPTKKDDYEENTPTCEQLTQTAYTPFVVIFLYKTSGRFLGMGSIIDKKTILTASPVVESSIHKPFSLLILAGRLSPWWGKDSQVKQADEIFQNDALLAIVILKDELSFNKNVLPIKMPLKAPPPDISSVYDKNWGVFGIPRSSWDIPGDPTSKTSMYLMKVETMVDKPDDCKKAYPDIEFNETYMVCTYANGSFCWGCQGSPTVAVDKNEKVNQIAVVVKTTNSELDQFHVHVKVSNFEQWIRSHSLVGYPRH